MRPGEKGVALTVPAHSRPPLHGHAKARGERPTTARLRSCGGCRDRVTRARQEPCQRSAVAAEVGLLVCWLLLCTPPPFHAHGQMCAHIGSLDSLPFHSGSLDSSLIYLPYVAVPHLALGALDLCRLLAFPQTSPHSPSLPPSPPRLPLEVGASRQLLTYMIRTGTLSLYQHLHIEHVIQHTITTIRFSIPL